MSTYLDDLIGEYSLPLGKSLSQLDDKELSNIELFHQEAMKNNLNFRIRELFDFDRPIEGSFPECSIVGDELYRKGKLEEAYEIFNSIDRCSMKATSLPMWSQGIYGMDLKVQNIDLPKIKLIFNNFVNREKIDYEFCVGFNSDYFPYLLILCNSLEEKPVRVNAVYCYEDILDENIIKRAKRIKNLRLFLIKTPIAFNKRNRKGFFTLSRYFLGNHISKNINSPLVIIDIDSKIKKLNLLDSYIEKFDIGILDLKNYRRPWLKNTAPFLYINHEVGHHFLNTMVKKYSLLIKRAVNNENLSLWGVDQSVITSVLDIFSIREIDTHVFNFIKESRHFMVQAQELSTKANFIKENSIQKELILHIGSYKTGTTSIQYNLFKNQQVLLKNNVNYLFSDLVDGVNQGNGKQLFHVKNDINNIVSYLKDAQGNIHILSDECFWHRPTRDKIIKAINLSQVYSKITVVGYLRRQDEYVESLYKQEQRSGLQYAAGKSVKDFIKELRDLRSLNFFEVISPYSNLNNNVKFVFRPFERKLLIREDVFFDFLHYNNLNFCEIVDYGSINESRGVTSSIIASLLWKVINENFKIMEVDSFDINSIKGKALLKIIRQYSNSASKLLDTEHSILSADQRTKLIEEFHESNMEFCKLYNIDKNSILYSSSPVKNSEKGIDDLFNNL